MRLVSVGDKVKPGIYKLHSRFNRVVNFVGFDCLVALVNEEIGSGPINIVTSEVNLKYINSLEVRENKIILDSLQFGFASSLLYNSAMQFTKVNENQLNANIKLFENIFFELSHPLGLAFVFDDFCNQQRSKNFVSEFAKNFTIHMKDAVNELVNGDLVVGVNKLKGCGFGLTPSGDDFIAGMLIGLNFLYALGIENRAVLQIAEKIYQVARRPDSSRRGSILINTFLFLAKNGWLTAKVKNLLFALAYQGKNEILINAKNLFAIGETSGSDIAAGFLKGVKSRPYCYP